MRKLDVILVTVNLAHKLGYNTRKLEVHVCDKKELMKYTKSNRVEAISITFTNGKVGIFYDRNKMRRTEYALPIIIHEVTHLFTRGNHTERFYRKFHDITRYELHKAIKMI